MSDKTKLFVSRWVENRGTTFRGATLWYVSLKALLVVAYLCCRRALPANNAGRRPHPPAYMRAPLHPTLLPPRFAITPAVRLLLIICLAWRALPARFNGLSLLLIERGYVSDSGYRCLRSRYGLFVMILLSDAPRKFGESALYIFDCWVFQVHVWRLQSLDKSSQCLSLQSEKVPWRRRQVEVR